MKINKIFGIQILLASFLFFLGVNAQAQTGDPVGLILSTSGNVTAEAEDGTERRLRRRSPIYEGDTVITAARARAQIRFNDNGLVALQPETSFLVEEHTFNGQEDGTESAVYRLFRGGLQAITGLIGNTNKDRYRFETPLATIGLRGTHWAATYCTTSCNGLAPGLYGGVAEGGIDVCNAGGCEDIDQDGYFYVQDQNTSPRTLVRKPSVVFEDTTSDRDEEQEEEGDSEEGDGDQTGNEDGDNDTAGGDGDTEGEGNGSDGDASQFGSTGAGGPDDGSEGGLGGDDEGLGQDFGGLDERDPVNCSNAPNAANPCGSGSGDGDNNTFSIRQLQSGEAQQAIEDRVTDPDSDGDGVPDAQDAFPLDANNWTDLDGDGFGDQTDDAFPGDANNWTDLDGDGFGDQTDDVFPNDPTEHADLDGDNIGDNSDPYPAFVTTEATSGSAVVLAGGNSALGGFNAVLEPDGQTVRVVLTEQGDVGNVYLDAVDTQNCAPSCEVEVVSGELIESGGISNFGGAGFGVNWGLWDLEQSGASLDGTPFDVGPNLHYGYTDNPMTDSEYETLLSSNQNTSLAPMVINYSLAGATSPTDQNGQLGTLNDASMTFDLYMQMVTAFSLDLDIGNLNYQAELFEPMSLMDESLLLVGRVNGGGADSYRYTLWGDTSLTLIGDDAEGVLGSYNLRHISEGFSIFSRPELLTTLLPVNTASGVYVLEQDGIVTAPNYYDGGLPFVDPQPDSKLVFALHEICYDGCEGPSGYAQAWGDIVYGSESESLGLVGINGHNNVPTMIPSYEESLVNINSGLLLDAASHSFGSGASVNYGRWYAEDAFYLGEMYGYSMLPNLHYGYTEDFYTDTPNVTDSIVSYQLVGGTAPTDEMGRAGHLNSVNLALDFYRNTVASFDLALTIEDRFYTAFMSGENSYDLSYFTSDLFIDLSGFCRGGDCGGGTPLTGETLLNLVGENTSAGLAEGIFGNFVLNTGFYGDFIGQEAIALDCVDCGYFPYDISTLSFPSAAGVFVLEQYESPLVVDVNSTFGTLQAAAFIGATSFMGAQAESFGALITPFTAGLTPSEVEPFPSTEVLSGDVRTVSLETVGGLPLNAVVGAELEDGSGISMEDGTLVRFGQYQNNGVQAQWGNWIGDVGITEPDETMAPYLHYLYTDDWSTSLPDVPVEQLEVFYRYAGGPSPADHRGYLGNVYDTSMTVNFGTATITDFWSYFAIDGAEYDVYFDSYNEIEGVNIYDVAIEQQGGLWGANIPLEGYCYGCLPNTYSVDLNGDATVAFAGVDAETALGTLAVSWEDYDGQESLVSGGATQSFILDREPLLYIDESTDSSLFVQADTGVAAVANLIDNAGIYSSLASIASTGNGDAIELIENDGDYNQLALSGYANADASSLIEEGGLARSGYSQIGKYQDVEVYWGMWNALQDFNLNGSPENALDFLPYAYSEQLTTGPFPSVPTGTLSSNADSVNYSNYGPSSSFMNWGSAVNSAGQISDYIDVDMGVDFTTGTIVSFDFYARFPSEDGYIGNNSYQAYLNDEGEDGIDLTGADLSNIVIPLAGSCDYCVSESYSAMEGYTRLAFIGERADGAIGSVSLVSGTYDEIVGFTEDGQASLAAAYVLEQYFQDRFYQSVYDQSFAAPAGAIALGASIVDTSLLGLSLGSLAVSGAAESGIELTTFEHNGYTTPNAVVAGDFIGESVLMGASVDLSLGMDEGELDYYDNAVDNDAGYEAYWGRWVSYDQVELDGDLLDTSGDHYFAYSDDLTDVNSIAPEIGTLEYGLYASSNPTDQGGSYGFLRDVYMAIDFATQSITDFNMDLHTYSTGDWLVSMTENSVALNGSAVSNFEVNGTVDGITPATGNVNTAIIGNNADAVLGAYNLSDTVYDYEVIGNFFLKEGHNVNP